jgi:hypothetical protein
MQAYPSGFRGAPAGSRVSGWDVVSSQEDPPVLNRSGEGARQYVAAQRDDRGERAAENPAGSDPERKEPKKGLFRRLLDVIK